MDKRKLLLAIATYLIWIIAFAVYNYNTSRDELLKELDLRLERAARNYLYVLPEGLHNKSMSKTDLTEEQDRALLLKSNEYADQNNIYYVYSMIEKEGKIYFTAGNAHEDDMAELKGGGFYFYYYEEAEPSMFNAFKQKAPEYHSTSDHWGNFRTVLIRFTAEDGTQFVIGADLTTDYIQAMLNRELISTLVISLLFFVFAFPMFLAFTASIREWAMSLKKEKDRATTNEAKFVSILRLAVDAIITTNESGEIIEFNNAAELMFGRSRQDSIGKNIEMIMPSFSDMKSEDFLSSGVKTESLAKTKDDKVFPIEVSLSRIELDNQQVILTAIVRDLTETKEREKKLHNLVEAAESASRAKSAFLNSMRHELRTPLHGILSYAEIGASKSDDAKREKLKEYFSVITKSGERLNALLDGLLDLSAFESGKAELNFANHDLYQMTSVCIAEKASLISSKGMDVVLNRQGESCMVECDGKYISQVLSNLLINAIKFSPENSRIEFSFSGCAQSVHKSGSTVEVTITDQGQGVAEDCREYIFEKFVQGGSPDNFVSGTGLGLAISREIIEAHHGKIWYQDNQPSGSKFIFQLPVSQS